MTVMQLFSLFLALVFGGLRPKNGGRIVRGYAYVTPVKYVFQHINDSSK
jgi:hypothetical protein